MPSQSRPMPPVLDPDRLLRTELHAARQVCEQAALVLRGVAPGVLDPRHVPSLLDAVEDWQQCVRIREL